MYFDVLKDLNNNSLMIILVSVLYNILSSDWLVKMCRVSEQLGGVVFLLPLCYSTFTLMLLLVHCLKIFEEYSILFTIILYTTGYFSASVVKYFWLLRNYGENTLHVCMFNWDISLCSFWISNVRSFLCCGFVIWDI